jgi:hypothetical protein
MTERRITRDTYPPPSGPSPLVLWGRAPTTEPQVGDLRLLESGGGDLNSRPLRPERRSWGSPTSTVVAKSQVRGYFWSMAVTAGSWRFAGYPRDGEGCRRGRRSSHGVPATSGLDLDADQLDRPVSLSSPWTGTLEAAFRFQSPCGPRRDLRRPREAHRTVCETARRWRAPRRRGSGGRRSAVRTTLGTQPGTELLDEGRGWRTIRRLIPEASVPRPAFRGARVPAGGHGRGTQAKPVGGPSLGRGTSFDQCPQVGNLCSHLSDAMLCEACRNSIGYVTSTYENIDVAGWVVVGLCGLNDPADFVTGVEVNVRRFRTVERRYHQPVLTFFRGQLVRCRG